jgi:hypothetical protein
MLNIKYLLREVYKSNNIYTLIYDFKTKAISITLNIINIYKSKIVIVLLIFSNVIFLYKLKDEYNIKSLNLSFLIIENKKCTTIIACKSFKRKVKGLKQELLVISYLYTKETSLLLRTISLNKTLNCFIYKCIPVLLTLYLIL